MPVAWAAVLLPGRVPWSRPCRRVLLTPCGIYRQHNAAYPLLSQGLKYLGFPTTVVSLSHSLTSSLLPRWVSLRGFRVKCQLMSNKVCSSFCGGEAARGAEVSGCPRCYT